VQFHPSSSLVSTCFGQRHFQVLDYTSSDDEDNDSDINTTDVDNNKNIDNFIHCNNIVNRDENNHSNDTTSSQSDKKNSNENNNSMCASTNIHNCNHDEISGSKLQQVVGKSGTKNMAKRKKPSNAASLSGFQIWKIGICRLTSTG
jgi:hypothetical protein